MLAAFAHSCEITIDALDMGLILGSRVKCQKNNRNLMMKELWFSRYEVLFSDRKTFICY